MEGLNVFEFVLNIMETAEQSAEKMSGADKKTYVLETIEAVIVSTYGQEYFHKVSWTLAPTIELIIGLSKHKSEINRVVQSYCCF